MKAFYKIENNQSAIGSGIIAPKGFIEYKVGKEPKELLDILSIENDIQRIQQINSKQDEIITKRDMYPIYKQLNIDNQLEPYTLDDKEIKNMFISTVRLIGSKAKENGTLVDDIDWAGLDKIESPSAINFEALKELRNEP